MSPKQAIIHGNAFPYDETDAWWNGGTYGRPPSPPKDWAHSAARGILEDLLLRQGIKHALRGVEDYTRKEIVRDLARIIRCAHENPPAKTPPVKYDRTNVLSAEVFLRAAELIDCGKHCTVFNALSDSASNANEIDYFVSRFFPLSDFAPHPEGQEHRILSLLLCHAMLSNP